jgi:hypothetical protein
VLANSGSTPDMVWRSAGSTFAGHGIRGVAGSGRGLGVVYRARHLPPQARDGVAGHRGGGLGRRDSRARFERELQAAAAIDHPNVSRYHAVQEQGLHGIDPGEIIEAVHARRPAMIPAGAGLALLAAR